MEWVVFFGFIAVVFAVLGAYIAAQKNRDQGEGLLLGCLFGPLGVLIEALLPIGHDQKTREEEREAAITERETATAGRDKAQKEWVAKQAKQALSWMSAVWEWHTARRARRDKAYRAMGIEPGPWAWYQALSDLKQAVVLGLAIGLPAGIALLAYFLILKPFGGR